jgi:hypothetical protein
MGRTANADQQALPADRKGRRRGAGHRERDDVLPQLLRAVARVVGELQRIMSGGVKVNGAVHSCGPLHTRMLRGSCASATVRRRAGTACWALTQAHPYQGQEADPLVMS